MPRKRGPGRPPKRRGPGRPPGSKNKTRRAAAPRRRRRTPVTARPRAARAGTHARAGRPKRVCFFCGAPALGGHVNRKLDETCGAHGFMWRQHADQSPVARAVVVAEIAKLTALLATLPADPDPFAAIPAAEPEAEPSEAEAPPEDPEAAAAPVIDAVTGTPVPPADHSATF